LSGQSGFGTITPLPLIRPPLPTLPMSTPDFDSLCAALQGIGRHVHPAELHGLACGILASGFDPSPDQWLQEAATYTEEAQLAFASPSPVMDIYSLSRQQLQEGDFAFALCLPDDDTCGLAERSESLARWCQGFLHGFAAIQSPLSEENRELLQDLTEISRLGMDAGEENEDSEENERYYAELTEFVRMAAISLFMDHHASHEPTGTRKQGHH